MLGLIFYLIKAPFKPREEGFDIGGIDGGATPDADASGGVAVTAEVVADAFVVEELDPLFGLGGLLFGSECFVPIGRYF